jgi:lipoprotein-anchoring transpeptidase ErfK/SrfK
MATGDIASNGFDLPGVPWVLYITEGGISFHGTYWHNDYGIPHSHGCINMSPIAAKWFYRWSMPTVPPDKYLMYGYIGTRVEIKV